MKDQIEKQAIEEMAKDLCDIECKGLKCDICDSYGCEYRMQAEALYNAGYRKQSEIAESKKLEIYNETMARLRLMGKKTRIDVIVALAEEIDHYRDKIRSMKAFITKHEGEWLPSPDGINPIRCNKCNMPAPFAAGENQFGDFEICRYPSNFCPYCGAHMKGGAE